MKAGPNQKTETSPGAQHEGLDVQLINGTPNQIIGANWYNLRSEERYIAKRRPKPYGIELKCP